MTRRRPRQRTKRNVGVFFVFIYFLFNNKFNIPALRGTVPCDAEYNCDVHATCEWIESDLANKCICKEGYTGDGYECVLESCQIVCILW